MKRFKRFMAVLTLAGVLSVGAPSVKAGPGDDIKQGAKDVSNGLVRATDKGVQNTQHFIHKHPLARRAGTGAAIGGVVAGPPGAAVGAGAGAAYHYAKTH